LKLEYFFKIQENTEQHDRKNEGRLTAPRELQGWQHSAR